MASQNVQWVDSWSGQALNMAGPPPQLLQFRVVEAEGRTNLSAAAGSIRFWFCPAWTSVRLGGAGPEAEGCLLEAGTPAAEATTGGWTLTIRPDGDGMVLRGQTMDGCFDLLTAAIAWRAGEWHLLTLTYSPEATALFVDDACVAKGDGLPRWLADSVQAANAFCLGGDTLGGSLAQGQFEEVTTFDYPLNTAEIGWYYQFIQPTVLLGSVSPEEEQARRSAAQQAKLAASQSALVAGEGAHTLMSSASYGCALWLDVAATNNAAVLTLHNTSEGRTYQVLSREDVVATSWTVETNVVGAAGQDWTQTIVPVGQRTNLFFRASEVRSYEVDTNSSFKGIDYSETGELAADTMGVIGKDHFVEVLNGRIAVFDRLGNRVAETNLMGFFSLEIGGTNYPGTGRMSDPRICYDHQSNRWVATVLAVPNNGLRQVVLAASNNDSPTNLLSNWTRYLVPVARPDAHSDYDTLGIDANGIYVTVLQVQSTTNGTFNMGHTVVAIRKADIYSQLTNFNYTVLHLGTNDDPAFTTWCIQPAVNFDDVATNGYAWFVAKGPPQYGTRDGTNYYVAGALCYRRLQWDTNGSTASWADTNWWWISASNVTYRDYYDLDGTNITVFATAGTGVGAPQQGGPARIDLHSVGSRLMMAVIRNGFLWTCHHVGLSGTNGLYVGDETGTNVDRSAVQWLKLQINATGEPLICQSHGRIFNGVATSALYYYFPSLMVNCAGDVVVGFSGSSVSDYIGAFFSWLPAGSSKASSPNLLQAGKNYYENNRWGDYSFTSLDPTDSLTFWTVQEYTEADDIGWGTWIAGIERTQ